jgi:uncharacterized membrane protein
MFEPYADPVSPKRRRVLSLDIHPIIVHFTITFAVCGLLLSLYSLIFPGLYVRTAVGATRFFTGFLPFFVIATFITGRIDGKLRFKTANSPLLRRKTIIGIIFFVLAVPGSVCALFYSPAELWVNLLNLGTMAGCVLCAFFLGKAGVRLLGAMFPG